MLQFRMVRFHERVRPQRHCSVYLQEVSERLHEILPIDMIRERILGHLYATNDLPFV
ncbi:MAG: hypothetical protein ACI8TL_000463 [Natronomonas sp.]|jgi:hypothetical protein